jgi:hypothetical protein
VKTALPKNIPFRPPRPSRALTILEMLVSTALLSVIVLGLTAMFIQTQKAFKTGIKQTTVTDAGRVIVDMIAADLSQMSDPHFTNVVYPPPNGSTLSAPSPPTLSWALVPSLQFVQNVYNNGVLVQRTNQSEDIFATVLTNNTWLGIGYTVSNWFTNSGGGTFPGVGTLYRYITNNTAPLWPTNQLFTDFNNAVALGFTNCHRIADGVVHLKIYAFDASGNEMYYEPLYDLGQSSYQNFPLQYPVIEPNPATGLYQAYYLPHSIDIELGILEPEALEHARALFAAGAFPAASNYLASAAGQVEIFRQHVIIPAAP